MTHGLGDFDSEAAKESIPKNGFRIPNRLGPSSPKGLSHRESGISKVPSHPFTDSQPGRSERTRSEYRSTIKSVRLSISGRGGSGAGPRGRGRGFGGVSPAAHAPGTGASRRLGIFDHRLGRQALGPLRNE